jgi:hypothetical protein
MRDNPTAAVATVAALWPAQGQRHSAYLALCGGLLRAGWTTERVEALIASLAEATHDEEIDARLSIVASTAARLARGEPCYGWPRLAELIGADAALSVRITLDCGLTVDRIAAAKQLPADFLRSLGVADAADRAGFVELRYPDVGGKTVAIRKRYSLSSKPRWEKGCKAVPYGEDHLAEAVKAGYLILCEGESDCWTLWHHGFPALGIPGSECSKVLQEGHVSPFKHIYVVQETDGAGERFVEGVARRLAELEWVGELHVIRMAEEKDPSALHCADPERFEERWRARMQEAEPIDLPALASVASISLPTEPPWPAPLADEAFHGLADELVRTLEPASEADPAALLVQFLAGFGSIIGRSAYCTVEADRHCGNEFFVLVGRTAKGRKGTSWGRIIQLLKAVDPKWADDRVQSGVSSGEGIIWAVRDPIRKMERIKERGEPVRYVEVEADPGVSDKRLLILESEFAGVLKHLERQGNIVSPVLRQAWESGDLRTLTKNNPARATGAHISMIGHVTAEELRRYLTASEQANGFGNRILWLCVRRSKELPEGGTVDAKALTALQARFAGALAFARQQRELTRDDGAREIWREVYGQLSADRPGLAGAMVGRAEAHVLRLSLLYALLDRSPCIQAAHLLAALALWDYCERSIKYIFGDSLGDGLADELLRLLRAAPDGLTRWEMSNALGRNQSANRIGNALALLAGQQLVQVEKIATGGRPEERWRALRK